MRIANSVERKACSLQPVACSFSLIHPHIIHHQPLRENSGSIGTARPVAPDSHVEDEVEGFIEGVGVGTQVCLIYSGINLSIHQPFDLVQFPLQGKDMEFIIENSGGQGLVAADLRTAWSGTKMKRGVHPVGFMADHFHQVDLAASWPAAIYIILGQEP